MGFRIAFGKTNKMGKYIGHYISDRMKEKRAYERQLKKFDAQLEKNTINKQIHDRLREDLEIEFIQQREEARACIKKQIQKTVILK